MGTLKIFNDPKSLDKLPKKGKKKMNMKVVRCANVINYACGCLCEYQLIGQFSHIPEWHIVPCYEHTKVREEIEKQVNRDWEEITSGVKR